MLRLALVSDAYLGQALYRLKASLQARGVPGLPRIAHRLAMAVRRSRSATRCSSTRAST